MQCNQFCKHLAAAGGVGKWEAYFAFHFSTPVFISDRSHSDSRLGYLPDHEPQRERVPSLGPALRSAQSDQGLGHGSRFHGARAHRQLEVHARRGALGGSGRQSLPDPLLDLQDGIDGTTAEIDNLRQAHRYLPDHIQQAIEDFKSSEWITEILGADVQGRFADLKQAAADRSPRELGTFVKGSEVQYHHEVYNQSLWNLF